MNAPSRDEAEREVAALEAARHQRAILRELDEARRAQGLSKAQLCRRAGLTPAHLSQILSGVRGAPRLDTVTDLAVALGLRVVLVSEPLVPQVESFLAGTPGLVSFRGEDLPLYAAEDDGREEES